MNFYYLKDGSAVGELNGLPYNFHPEATPEQWAWFKGQLGEGLFVEVSRPPDPEPAPEDYIFLENVWRESEMLRAQKTVTALDYGEEGIPGTQRQWKDYWLALRKWTETNPDFPDSAKRPKAPE
jgi:hypothetical protein